MAAARPRLDQTSHVTRTVVVGVTVALVVLGAAVRLLGMRAQSVWLDEAYSMAVARHSVAYIASFTVHYDLHPPLYYVLLHFWQVVGGGALSARLLSVIFGIAAIPALYALTAGLFDRATARWAALLLAVSPIAIWYADEARMYAAVEALVAAALACLVWAGRGGRPMLWGGYVVFAALALYTDYSAGYILLGAIVSWALFLRGDRRRLRQWLVSNVALVVIALPLLPVLYLQRQNLGEIAFVPRPSASSVGTTLIDLVSVHATNTVLVVAVAVGLTVLGAVALRRDWDSALRGRYGFVAGIGLAPLVVPLALSLIHPVFLTRTVLTAELGILIFFARGLVGALRRPTALRALAVAPLLAVNGLSLHAAVTSTLRENWRAAARYVHQQAFPGDALIFDPAYGQLPFDVYWNPTPRANAQYGYPYQDGLLASHPASLQSPAAIQRAVGPARTVWLIDRGYGVTSVPRDVVGTWLRQHLTPAGERQFLGITVFRFTTLPVAAGSAASDWSAAAAAVLRHVAPHDLVVLSGSGSAAFNSAWQEHAHPPVTIIQAPANYASNPFTSSDLAGARHIWLVTAPRGSADPAGIAHDWLYHHGPQARPMQTLGPLRVYEFNDGWGRS
ncbi:MAG TPA: glycosyltransferase family 39 protein [Thermomicrobiaceae bacterium]|nr:glycosyltransferase family 39 protein [Thermomicrobiaceae bacterium]